MRIVKMFILGEHHGLLNATISSNSGYLIAKESSPVVTSSLLIFANFVGA